MTDQYYYEECGDMTAPFQLIDAGTEVKSARRERELSRERSRSRERQKDKSKDRKKSRRRSKDRSRNRSRSRSYSRSRSRDRSRSRRRSSKKSRVYYDEDSDSNESSRLREDSPPGYRNYDKYDSQRGAIKGKWNDGIPNNVILIRNLPINFTEQDIKNVFLKYGITVREIRLMRSRETGQSLRYCFVEFHSIPEAQYWMDMNQGELRLDNSSTLYMYYSTTRRGNINNVSANDTLDSMSDWLCNKCNCKNFQRRTFCRRCSHIREDTTKRLMSAGCSMSDGSDQVGSNPCNTLLLRGLDGLTTEESIQAVISQLIVIPITNCRVMRDPMTGTSNGYAFVEFGSVKESKQALQQLVDLDDPIEVDGKALIVDYAKNTFSTAIAKFESDVNSSATYYGQSQQPYSSSQDISANQAAAVVQAALMKATQNKKATAIILQQQQLHYQQQAASSSTATGLLGSYASPIASSQAASANLPVQTTSLPVATDDFEYPRYPTPDTSKFTYDESSGYYFDATTTFYYDAKSQYFYNTQRQHFMYWDGNQHTYIPVACTTTQKQGDDLSTTLDTTKKSESPEKVKVAKKIVKDMEKWVKKMNSHKEMKKSLDSQGQQQNNNPSQQQLPSSSSLASSSSSLAPDVGYSVLEKTSTTSNRSNLELQNDAYSLQNKNRYDAQNNSPVHHSKDSISSLFNYESQQDYQHHKNQQDEDYYQQQQQQQMQQSSSSSFPSSGQQQRVWRNENEMIDWPKMTCLLCRRVFTTKETLVKHQQFSDLHKKNLEDYQRSNAEFFENSLESQQYRDRARERREKFGESDPPPKRDKKYRIDVETVLIPETPTQNGIKEDNVGNRLLQKMGWKDGQGLGRAGQGIVNPIEATIRQGQAGLGSRGSAYNVNPSGSYHDRLKSTFRAYFDEIN